MWNSSLKHKISTCHRKLWPAELVREAVLSWKRQKVNWKFHSDETSSKKIPLRWKPRPKKIPLWWKTRPKNSTPMETCSKNSNSLENSSKKIPLRWKPRSKKFHSDGKLVQSFPNTEFIKTDMKILTLLQNVFLFSCNTYWNIFFFHSGLFLDRSEKKTKTLDGGEESWKGLTFKGGWRSGVDI